MSSTTTGTTLDLVLKGEWFRMIESGEKKEEYRDLKSFWCNRLLTSRYPDGWNYLTGYYNAKHQFVRFRLGYAKDAPTMTFKLDQVSVGLAKPEWSGNWQGNVFRIHLGQRIN